jgi:hypothetical protein
MAVNSRNLTVRRATAIGFERFFLVRFASLGIPRSWRARTGKRGTVILFKSYAPLAIAALLQLCGPRIAFSSATPFFYILGFCSICFLATLAAWQAIAQMFKLAEGIDELVGRGSIEIERVCTRYIRRLSWWRQTWVTIVGIAAGDAFLSITSRSLVGHLEIKPASYVSVTMTSAIAANGFYLMITGLRLVSTALLSPGPKALLWHTPAQTPILRRLTMYSGVLAMYAIVVTGLTELVASLVPARQHSLALKVLFIGFPIFSASCILLLLGFGHVIISTVVRRGKEVSLLRLDALIGEMDGLQEFPAIHHRKDLLDIYTAVLRSPSLPYSLAAYVPLIAALVAPLTAYILAQFL